MAQDQRIRYEQGSLEDGDSGDRANPDAIKPYIDGEVVHALVFNRPVDNTYERTEVVRTALEALKYRMDVDPYWIITGGDDAGVGAEPPGIASWEPGTGIFTTTDEIVVQSIKSIGADNKTAISWVFDSGLTPVDFKMDGLLIAADGGDLPEVRLEYTSDPSVITLTTIGDPVTTLHVLVSDDATVNLFAMKAAFETAGMLAVLDKLFTQDWTTGNLNTTIGGVEGTDRPNAGTYNFQDTSEREYHYISDAAFVSFFNTAANRLSDGDSLGIYYLTLADPDDFLDPGAGSSTGRRQSCVTNANVNVTDSMLFNSTREPEKLADCIPLCKRVGDNLYWVDGTNVSGTQHPTTFPILFGSNGIGIPIYDFYETVTIDCTGASNPDPDPALYAYSKGSGRAIHASAQDRVGVTLTTPSYAGGGALAAYAANLDDITASAPGGILSVRTGTSLAGGVITDITNSASDSFSEINVQRALEVALPSITNITQDYTMVQVENDDAVYWDDHDIYGVTVPNLTGGVFLGALLHLGTQMLGGITLTDTGAITPIVKTDAYLEIGDNAIENVDIYGTLSAIQLDSHIELGEGTIAGVDVYSTGTLGAIYKLPAVAIGDQTIVDIDVETGGAIELIRHDVIVELEGAGVMEVEVPEIPDSINLKGSLDLGALEISAIDLTDVAGSTEGLYIGAAITSGQRGIEDVTVLGEMEEIVIYPYFNVNEPSTIAEIEAPWVGGEITIDGWLKFPAQEITAVHLLAAGEDSESIGVGSILRTGSTMVGADTDVAGHLEEMYIADAIYLSSFQISNPEIFSVAEITIGAVLALSERAITDVTLTDPALAADDINIEEGIDLGYTKIEDVTFDGGVGEISIKPAFESRTSLIQSIVGDGQVEVLAIDDRISMGTARIGEIETFVGSEVLGGHGIKTSSPVIELEATQNNEYWVSTGCGGHFVAGTITVPSAFDGEMPDFVPLDGEYFSGVYGEGSTMESDFSGTPDFIFGGTGGFFLGGDCYHQGIGSWGGAGVVATGGVGHGTTAGGGNGVMGYGRDSNVLSGNPLIHMAGYGVGGTGGNQTEVTGTVDDLPAPGVSGLGGSNAGLGVGGPGVVGYGGYSTWDYCGAGVAGYGYLLVDAGEVGGFGGWFIGSHVNPSPAGVIATPGIGLYALGGSGGDSHGAPGAVLAGGEALTDGMIAGDGLRGIGGGGGKEVGPVLEDAIAGRGGWFQGGNYFDRTTSPPGVWHTRAALHIEPCILTRPLAADAEAGDMIVDASGILWMWCNVGGWNWHKVSTQ